MNILYFGTVCDLNHYNKILEECTQKPTVATVVFESALLEGFKQNGAEVEIHSFPMIPTYPKSKLFCFGKNIETLACGYTCRWLHTVNIPVLKQISRRQDAKRILHRWLKDHKNDGLIFTYSIPPFLAKDILKYSQKYGVKTVAIIPDLLQDMYINENAKSPITKLKQMYLKSALKRQGEYTGYVYLTDAMHDVVAPDKPYIVMEGIAHIDDITASAIKAYPRAVMYAGMLFEKYGIMNLVEAFEQIDDPDLQMWLFGTGTAVPLIEEHAARDPRIIYYGSLPRDKILQYERKATLLVNPRDPDEAFTQYSFPSKTIEYMLSGTPLLTTRLKGIPDEYETYVFMVDDNRVETLRAEMTRILAQSPEERAAFGSAARQFIVEEKNARRQASRILDFLKEVHHGTTH
ncbi:MAG: glycosyltransferase [Eubacteriales bacterium]